MFGPPPSADCVKLSFAIVFQVGTSNCAHGLLTTVFSSRFLNIAIRQSRAPLVAVLKLFQTIFQLSSVIERTAWLKKASQSILNSLTVSFRARIRLSLLNPAFLLHCSPSLKFRSFSLFPSLSYLQSVDAVSTKQHLHIQGVRLAWRVLPSLSCVRALEL